MAAQTPYSARNVFLNVYDMIENNGFLYGVGLGIVHTGVVVDGREYSYGEGGGIISTKPKNISGVKFRETILIGSTYLSPEEIKEVISNMEKTFRGDNYNLTHQNCNTFSNEFCKIIVGKEIPKHINRCASVANWFSGVGNRISHFVNDLDLNKPVFKEDHSSQSTKVNNIK